MTDREYFLGNEGSKGQRIQQRLRTLLGSSDRLPTYRRKAVFESLERRDLLSGQPDLGFEWGGSPAANGAVYAGEGESSPMVQYRLNLTDTSNQPLPTDANGNPKVAVGDTFRLWGYNKDVRSPATPRCLRR